MKYKINIAAIIYILGFCNIVTSQEKELSEKQIEMIYNITYEMNSGMFKKPIYAFKEKELDLDQSMIKVHTSISDINSSIDSLLTNAKIKIDKNSFYSLVLDSKFPSYFKEDSPSQVIDIDFKNSILLNAKEDTVKVKDVGAATFGSDFYYSRKNDKEINLNFTTVYRQNQIENEENVIEPIQGQATYIINFITDYGSVKLSKKDIGNTFRLSKNEFKLIDIFHNKIVIDCLTTQDGDVKNEMGLIILNEEGDKELAPYSMMELYELKQKDENYENVQSFSMSKMTIYQNIFEIFSSNKDISKEEFKELFPVDKMKSTKNTNRFILLVGPAPIENEVILYQPIYGVSKEITIKL